MKLILENKHGNIWAKSYFHHSVNTVKMKTCNETDMHSFRMLLNRCYRYDFGTVNKIMGDMLHHGSCFMINNPMEEV